MDSESYLDYVRDYLRELGADPSYDDIVRFLAYRFLITKIISYLVKSDKF